MREKWEILLVVITIVMLGNMASAQTKMSHPHDIEFQRLLDGDLEAIALHWTLGEKLGKEDAGYWEYDFAYACWHVVRCFDRKLKMPQWVKYPHNKRADQPVLPSSLTEPDEARVTKMQQRIGALLAMLYTIEHDTYFTKSSNRARMNAGEKLMEHLKADAEYKAELGKETRNNGPGSLTYVWAEKLAWIEHRSGLTSIYKQVEELGFYQLLIENRQYARAALIACRYNLGVAALRNAADMIQDPPEEVRTRGRLDTDPLPWDEWLQEALESLEKGQACSDELWRKKTPDLMRYELTH